MKPQTAIIKIRTRLNKIHSSDYDNIEDWAAIEAVNKAALEITRNLVSGKLQTQDGSEETGFRVVDVQHLLKSVNLKGTNANPKFFELKIPKDFLWFNSIVPYASKGSCENVNIISNFREQANAQKLLEDYNQKPSFEWRETFHTFLSDKIRIYKDNFDIENVDLIYYRKPVKMDIVGYIHEDGTPSSNVDLEFKDDLCELIIDAAAAIIAGDIESLNQAQINTQRKDINI